MVHLLASAPDEALIREVARGLSLIFEHISYLQMSVETLADKKQSRGEAAVRAIADEEAAKYLILVDVIRCPRKAQKQRSRQLKRCNSHLPKGIYACISGMSPADLDEVRRIVKGLRASHYLDGPTDYDWIFRNEIEDRRERTLYVDYVRTDEGADWVAPNVYDDELFLHGDPSGVVRIVFALTRAGVASAFGLKVIADVWRDFVPVGKTRWPEVERRNRSTLNLLEANDLIADAFTDRDEHVFLDEWTFPMHHEDLSIIEVDPDDLRKKQTEWRPEY